MAETTRIDSLNVLLDSTGKMLLAEAYDGVIDNVQKNAISFIIKNTDLSGTPETGTVEAKRFVNAVSATYGSARTANKGTALKGKPVTVKLDQNKEFVEEIEEKDASLLGVSGLIEKRSANHAKRLEAELDSAMFAEAKTSGTAFTPGSGVTAVQDIVESMIVTLETLKNDYIDGIDRDMMSLILSPDYYSKMRTYLDNTAHNANVDTAAEQFIRYHGVKVFSSHRLPVSVSGKTTSTTQAVLVMDGSIAQPLMVNEYKTEKIPLSDAIALEMFFYYGTKAVTPETILTYSTSVTSD